jgi:hypothetical protein
VKAQARLALVGPRRANPKGAPGGRRAKNVLGRKGLWPGLKPRNRGSAGRPAAPAAGETSSETVCGCFRAETFGYLARGERFEGVIP